MNGVRTYMNFTKEIDPAHILTMSDLEISIVLASTLVDFDHERQVVAGLAEKWEIVTSNKIRFLFRKGMKWSDGSPVTASQYLEALERAKKVYGSDLKALFDAIQKIEAPDDSSLVFTTKDDVAKSGILLKLTEPMYGLVAMKNGALDLSKSVGPFSVEEHDDNRLLLAANHNWYAFASGIPETVEIRRPKEGMDLIESFEGDDWVNLISASSMVRANTMVRLKHKGYRVLERSLDKVFSLYPTKRFIEAGGTDFIKKLVGKIKLSELLEGFSGYSEADQFFPRGYVLYSTQKPKFSSTKISEKTQNHVSVIIPGTPVETRFSQKLAEILSEVTHTKVTVEVVPLLKINERMKRADYDVLATALGVADPNFEGAMSFFIEREPAFIQSTSGENDFRKEIREARGLGTSSERAERMREITVRAQEVGYFLPLYHFSSLLLAKPGIDISEIPSSDETINFSKIRIR